MAIFAVFLLLFFLVPGAIVLLVTMRVHAPAHEERRQAQTAELRRVAAREEALDPRQLAHDDQEHRHRLEREKQEADIFLAKIHEAAAWWFRDIGTSGTIMPAGAAYQTIYPIRAQAPEPEPAPVFAAPQTFRELLQAGTLQAALARGQLLLGYTGGELRYGSWLDLYSCGIGGVSGSGKTTTTRFLLFQALLSNARLVMVDPHIADEEESLAYQFRSFPDVHIMEPCDSTAPLVLKRVRYLMAEFEDRKATGRKGPPIILVCDEFNALMRVPTVRDEMANLLLNIEQEARKFGIYGMLLGQRWSQQDIGGADIRSSLASVLAHRFTDQDAAKKLIGSKAAAKCLELQQGHYLFRDTSGGLSEMITPLTTADDGRLVARMIAGCNPVATDLHAANGLQADSPILQTGREITTAALDAPSRDVRAIQVRAMLKEGFSPPRIVKELWGVSNGGAYTKAMNELAEIIARLV